MGERGLTGRRRRPFDIRLGRIAGIPIVISASWLFSVVVIVFLATPVVRRFSPQFPVWAAALVSALLAVLLGLSVLAHELGHCLAARALGMEVREVRLHLIGGLSELVRAPATAREELIVASAGPATSALLAAVCGLLLGSTEYGTLGWLIVIDLALANAIVAVFNILPALPLDGGRVLRAAVWGVFRRYRLGTIVACFGGFAVSCALVVWAMVAIGRGGHAALLEAGIAVVLAVFIGMGAAAELPRRDDRELGAGLDTPGAAQVASVREYPPGESRPDTRPASLAAMTRPVRPLPDQTPLTEAIPAAATSMVLLIRGDGTVLGLLDIGRAQRLTAESPTAPAAMAALPLAPGMIVMPGESLRALAERYRASLAPYFVMVGDDGRPEGIVMGRDIAAVAAQTGDDVMPR